MMGEGIANLNALHVIDEKETTLFSRYSMSIFFISKGRGWWRMDFRGLAMERLRIGGCRCLAWPPAKHLCLYIL